MTRRGLSPDDRALWERVRQSVRPIRHGRYRGPGDTQAGPVPEPPGAEEEPIPALREAAASAGASAARAATPEQPIPTLPPLAPFQPKERRRLGRGAAEPDGRLDLHGMRQTAAFHALWAFLQAAQARGARTVLIITGKGRAADQDSGILRQVVPRWLAEPQFRGLVVGFEPASRRHGGEGAFYVRLRRRR